MTNVMPVMLQTGQFEAADSIGHCERLFRCKSPRKNSWAEQKGEAEQGGSSY